MSIYIACLLLHLSVGSFHGQRDSHHIEHALHFIYFFFNAAANDDMPSCFLQRDNWQ